MTDIILIKQLREITKAGFKDCKEALQNTSNDMDEAIKFLRKKGLSDANKKSGRTTSEGRVHSYIHMGKIGALVEISCETDFVANTDDFKEFCNEVAMQIVAKNPVCVSREQMPAEELEKERKFLQEKALADGKPEHILDKIVVGQLEKYICERVLLEQSYIKEPKQTVSDLLKSLISKVGENVQIKRFSRFEI